MPKSSAVMSGSAVMKRVDTDRVVSPTLPNFGQHLLHWRWVADALAEAALPQSSSPPASVAEIGVGAGALTKSLLAHAGCKRVVGFEVDDAVLQPAIAAGGVLHSAGACVAQLPDQAEAWTRRGDWAAEMRKHEERRCVVFHGDFLRCATLPFECSVAVGNVPYRISAALVLRLLCARPPLRVIVILVQAEFARRLIARPGDPKYGRLAVLTATMCDTRELVLKEPIPAEAFIPPPRVDSAIVRLVPKRVGLEYMGRPVLIRTLDQLLRAAFDGARGNARGLSLEATLQNRAAKLELPPGWREAVARVGVGSRAVVTLEPDCFLSLAVELESLGWFGEALAESEE